VTVCCIDICVGVVVVNNSHTKELIQTELLCLIDLCHRNTHINTISTYLCQIKM